MSPYGVGGVHRHTPEIEQNLTAAGGRRRSGCPSPRRWRRCRGASSPPAPHRWPPGSTPPRVRDAWVAAYADEPFVHVLPEGQWPSTASVLGSNSVHVQVTVDERVGRVVAVAAVDNLTKGTAGAPCSA